ncbi:MAG TPA: aldo/keto reductase [Spirochaetia bacterium]|nr:aldo/keto reductase [Spirochaetia bacterium]
MRTVPLGDSGADVSCMCLGAMYLGTRTDPALSRKLLDEYVDRGGTFIDTANIYAHWIAGFHGGESETLIGEWMRERGNRSRLFLASKVGFEYSSVPRRLTASLVQAECDKSLRRLGVDTIDLYYAHVDDRATPIKDTLAAFGRLVKSGKVRYIGASNFLAWRLADCRALSAASSLPGYCCIQQRHTYLRPRRGASFDPQIAANSDLLDWCASTRCTLLAYSPLLGGAYTRADRSIPEQYRGPDTEARLKSLGAVAREVGATANQVVLAWLMQAEPEAIPVMAAGAMDQLKENLGALDLRLSREQIETLSKASAV